MLSSHDYNHKVDVWSAGCTFGELISGKIMFPGNHYIEQINLIINMRGTPDEATKTQISNEFALKYVNSLPLKAKVDLKELFPGSPPLALDLIDKLLNLNPNERIEIEEALRHPFLEMLHDPEDEPVFEGTIDFGFESDPNLDLDSIMRLIFK